MPSLGGLNVMRLLTMLAQKRRKTVPILLGIAICVTCTLVFFDYQYKYVMQDVKESLYVLVSGLHLMTHFYDPRLPTETLSDLEMNLNSTCVHPDFQLWPPEVRDAFYMFSNVACDSQKDWVYVHNSTFFISDKAEKQFGPITCDYYPVTRVNHMKSTLGKVVPSFKNNTRLVSDFFEVDCRSGKSSDRYHNLHAGVVPIPTRPEEPSRAHLNVVILGLDSLSRLGWLRNMPQAYQYLTQTLGGVVLKKYNIVGDGTLRSLTALLTGHYLSELPESRVGYAGAETLDSYPFIWRNYSQAGYVTQFAEDWPLFWIFSNGRLGFDHAPVDHHLNAILARLNAVQPPYCLGDQPIHNVILNYIQELYAAYPHTPKFSFNFLSRLSHNRIDSGQRMDDDIVAWLKKFHGDGHLNNTLLILMSDHGLRAGSFRISAQGKYEERLPFMSLVLPPWFRDKFPHAMANLKDNAYRLSTPFDIHATLAHILDLTAMDNNIRAQERGISLFRSIPLERTCDHIGIDPHWCTCLEQKQVDVTDSEVIRISQYVVQDINKQLVKHFHVCSRLGLEQVLSAVVLAANDNFQKFRYFKDQEESDPLVSSREGAGGSSTSLQVAIETSPGRAQFEATVQTLDSGGMMVSQLSRINLYGDQSKCVSERYPHLRPFCYCL